MWASQRSRCKTLGAPKDDLSNANASWEPMSRSLSAAKARSSQQIALAAESLRDIGSQDALTLLRSSFGAPKVLHLLCCVQSRAMKQWCTQKRSIGNINAASESAIHFLTVLGKKIAQQTGDECETAFRFQHLSILVQRFNCVLLYDSFVHDDCPD